MNAWFHKYISREPFRFCLVQKQEQARLFKIQTADKLLTKWQAHNAELIMCTISILQIKYAAKI